jgi:hypothetical protein
MEAVVSRRGIEVPARGLEFWRIALGTLVKVDGVLTRDQSLEGKMNRNSLCPLL